MSSERRHADHDDVMGSDRGLRLGDDVGVVISEVAAPTRSPERHDPRKA